MSEVVTIRRILFVSHSCYLDDSNGAAVSSRELMQTLARSGFAVEVLCGSVLDLVEEVELASWLAGRGLLLEGFGGQSFSLDPRGTRAEIPACFRLSVKGVPITLHPGPTTRPHEPDDAERRDFLRLYDEILDRFQPEVVVGYGGSRLQAEVFAKARARGLVTLFNLHNCRYTAPGPFANVNVARVTSRFAANHYREALGLDCEVLPNIIDFDRVRVEEPEPRYVTFVNPTPEKGVFPFARIVDTLGRRRPDIPFLERVEKA